MDSKFIKPDQADFWSVLVRVPASATITLQGLSGLSGLYIEPRTTCGRQPDDKFGMVWLGELPLQDISHRLKTTANAVAIGRLRTRYGLRFATRHLQEAFAELKPSETFVAGQVQQLYRLYPVPFGTQRVALQKCLTQWGWSARVRQAMGGGEDGTAWEVGATKEPPSSILPGPSGDITVTLLRTMTKQHTPAPLLASSNTRKFLQQTKPSQTTRGDHGRALLAAQPHLVHPTSCNNWMTNGRAASQKRPSERLPTLRPRRKQEVTMTPAIPDGFVAATEGRFARLETGMQELRAQSVKHEQWFNQMHATEQQMAQQIETQGHHIEQVRKDLDSKTNSLKDGLDRVETEISRGFSQMEALLEKKNKTS